MVRDTHARRSRPGRSRAALLAARLAEADADAAVRRAKIAHDAVAGGLLEAEDDVPMPVLSLPSMGGSMSEMDAKSGAGMSGGGRAGGMQRGKSMRRTRPGAPSPGPDLNPDSDDSPVSAPGAGGMGM
jgi:hypothetical protein